MALAPSSTVDDDDGTPPHPWRWAMLTGVWLLYFSFGLTVASLAPVVFQVEQDLGIEHATMGLILGAWPLTYIASSAPCGALLDRFGPQRMLFIAAVIIALSGALRGVSESATALFLSVVVFGIGGPLVSSGAPKVISLWFKGQNRGLAIGIYFTGNALGGIVSLSLANSVFLPFLGDDWRALLLCYAAFVMLAGFVWLLISSHPASRAMEKLLAAEKRIPYRQVFMELIHMPVVRIALAMGIFILAFNHGLNNWLPTILQSYGMTASEAGYWSAIPTMFGMLAALSLPRLATRERRMMILYGLVISAGVTTIMIWSAEPTLLAIGVVLQGACRGALTSILILLLMDNDAIPTNRVGAVSGLYFSAAEIGGALGPMSMGAIAQATGSFDGSLFMLTCVSVILFALLTRLYVITKRESAASPQSS